MNHEPTNDQRAVTHRQVQAILAGDPHTPALYRLLQPCDWRDRYLVEQATRDKICDDRHEANRPCRVRR